MVSRGCGTRVPGGAYIVCPLTREGVELEQFLIDPPVAIGEDLGVSSIGLKFVPAVGDRPAMLLDWVGAKHYPNVADFVEEVKRYGMSRRISKRFDFSQIVPGTRHVLIHPHAVIENAADYWANGSLHNCPKATGAEHGSAASKVAAEHSNVGYQGMCAGLWWQDLTGTKMGVRTMPAFEYQGLPTPGGVTPKYLAGMFLALPAVRIEVVTTDDGSHQETLERARKSGLRVKEVEE